MTYALRTQVVATFLRFVRQVANFPKRIYTLSSYHFYVRLFLITVAAMLPAWCYLHAFWAFDVDVALRLLMLKETTAQVLSGDIYPRWLMHANNGLGSPLMIFQPMLTNYIGILLAPLAPVDPYGYGRLWLSVQVFLICGGVFTYHWLSVYFPEKRAQYGAFFYVIMSSLIQAWHGYTPMVLAQMLAPLCMLVAHYMVSDPIRFAWRYALLIALLCFTSLPYVVVFGAVPVLYAVIHANPAMRLRVAVYISVASFGGLLLAGIYWMPAAMNRTYIMYTDFIAGYYDYRNQFWRIFRPPTGYAGMRQYIRMVYYVLPLIVGLVWVWRRRPWTEYKKTQVFFLFVCMASVFMTLPVSRILWDRFEILQNLQFPIRFMSNYVLAMIFLMTCWMHKIPVKSICISAILLLVAWTIMEMQAAPNHRVMPPAMRAQVLYKLVPQESHMTIWMRNAGMRDPLALPVSLLNMPPYVNLSGGAELSPVDQTSRRITFHAKVSTPQAFVVLKRFFYPGWMVSAGPTSGISIHEHRSLLALSLPKGDYDIVLEQPWFPGEKQGLYISILGCVLGLGLWLISKRASKHPVVL